LTHDIEPRIGLFWFVGEDGDELVGLSRPAAAVPNIGGFCTIDESHYDVWRRLSQSRADLSEYGYEFFPRGRVNWSDADGFMLLADKSILASGRYSAVITEWHLPGSTKIMTDPHYRQHSLTTIIIERNL
jgi:hypothetical protein